LCLQTGKLVEENMADIVTTGKAVFSVGKSALKLRDILSDNKKLKEKWEEISDEVLSELGVRMNNVEARLDESERRLLEEEQQRPDAQAYARRMFAEAVNSITPERRQMLSAALVGGMMPDFDAETRSRVYRVLTQLEPSDVVLLRAIRDQALDAAGFGSVLPALTENRMSATQLVQLALIRIDSFDGDSFFDDDARPKRVTLLQLGKEVLRVVEDWTPASDHTGGGG
jgi:hypothetical protein